MKKSTAPDIPKMLALAIKDRAALAAAYIPFLKNGGLFIPTVHPYKLKDEVFILLSLMDAPEKILANGQVTWITPKGCHGGRVQGVGVHFDESENSRMLRRKIEENLGGAVKGARVTHTM